jgi:hypothetical protein
MPETQELEVSVPQAQSHIETPVTALQQKMGKSARARVEARRRKRKELMESTRFDGQRYWGPCAPATIVNLNPIALTLSGGLERYTVPIAGEGNNLPIKIKYKGREFKASYVTFTEPFLYDIMRDFEESGSDVYVKTDVGYVPPVGLVHQFYAHYVIGAVDYQRMGGIIIFEGGVHTLEHLHKNADMIRVPSVESQLDSQKRFVYASVERKFADVVAETLMMQREFANGVIARGHQYYTSQSDMERQRLTSYHILWHNWAMDQGYKREPEEWASERLEDSPDIQAVHCPSCYERQKNPAQYFCSNCNTAFDACEAFLAGKPVPDDQLSIYPQGSKQFDAILVEKKRRRENMALLQTPEDVRKKKSE